MSKSFEDALTLPLNCQSKYILFSDCHRGTGKANDNFLKNEFLYLAALKYYFQHEFTYLELGDGDELWENRSMKKIKEMHGHSFEMMAKFYRKKRLYMTFGRNSLTHIIVINICVKIRCVRIVAFILALFSAIRLGGEIFI